MIRMTSAQRSTPGPVTARVLYLTNQSPFPPHSGGQLREWQFLSRLSHAYAVHLVAVTSHLQRDLGCAGELLKHCRTVTFIQAVPGAAAPGTPERLRAVMSAEVAPCLAQFARRNQLDFVHVEGYFLMHHLPAELGLPIFLVEENIEYQLDRARQELDGDTGTDWTVTRSLERQAWRRAARCGAVTLEDVAAIRSYLQSAAVHWLPPGCDHFSPDDPAGAILAGLPTSGPRVVYTGNASWGPSRDATWYLLDEIWPKVHAAVPEAHLVIAGSGQRPAELGRANLDRSVHLCGVLPSLGPLLHSADVFVCPLRFGGGIKSKILESLRAGRAIVSSPVGLQGLPPPARDSVLEGGTTAELADRIIALLLDRGLREELQAKARAAARFLTTWDDATRRLDAAWSAMLTSARAGQGGGPEALGRLPSA